MKLIAGFLLGVVATIIVVYWFAEEPPVMRSSPASRPSISVEAAEVKQAVSASTDDKVTETSRDATNMPTSDQSVPNVESVATQPQAASVQQRGADSTSPDQGSSTSSARRKSRLLGASSFLQADRRHGADIQRYVIRLVLGGRNRDQRHHRVCSVHGALSYWLGPPDIIHGIVSRKNPCDVRKKRTGAEVIGLISGRVQCSS